ncbi:ketopantoate reductase family protein [Massilia sp. PWRC2]|uniref:ketopantoate reductase family protein n=1 Tax=Massilia sp. PWRC2 TaxID=2804626 RepID=UPI003CE6B65B
MPPIEALRIAVVGAGKIGSTFAFQLARAGHAVTVVARPASHRLAQLQAQQAIVKTNGERAAVAVCSALDESLAYDLVLVTVLAHQVDLLIPSLQRSAARRLLFAFNNFTPQVLRDALGPLRCDFGMPFVQATLDAAGRLQAQIGAGGQKTRLGAQCWVDLFNDAGLPAVLESDMLRWLRCHVPLCVAFESVSVAAVRRGGGVSWAEAQLVARGMHEAFALVVSLGAPLYPAGKARLAGAPVWVAGAMLWSVARIKPFRELLAGGVDECRALVDTMTAAAELTNPAMAWANIAAMRPPFNPPRNA